MINHAKTLLVNLPPSMIPASWSLEANYVDPEFVPVQLPPWLATLHRVLLGGTETWHTFYNVDQMLRIVHSSDYRDYLLASDARITYDPMSAVPAAVVSVAPATSIVSRIAACRNMSSELGRLFGTAAVEPYLTFYGLFAQQLSFVDSVAGLVLAALWRTNELFKPKPVKRIPTQRQWVTATVTTGSVTDIGYADATVSGTVTAREQMPSVTERGFCWNEAVVVPPTVAPVVATGTVTGVGYDTATVTGTVTAQESAPAVTERGFCWNEAAE